MGAVIGGFMASTAGAAMAKTDLTFWSWRQEDRAFYQDIIKKFQEKEPDITVKFETYANENYATILSTALAAGRGPDVIQVRAYGNLESVATPGYLLALDTTNVPELANFPEAALAAETLRSDGKVYAVPFATQAQLIVYNKKIFADNGLKVPQTWDELMDVAKALKAKNINPFTNGTATSWQNETIVGGLLSSMLGKSFEDDIVTGKANFTDPRFVNALTKLKEISQYFAPNFTGVDYPSSQQLFVAGRGAMFAGGSYEVANFKGQNPRPRSRRLPVAAAQGRRRGADRDLLRWRLRGERQVRQEGRGAEVRAVPGDPGVRHGLHQHAEEPVADQGHQDRGPGHAGRREARGQRHVVPDARALPLPGAVGLGAAAIQRPEDAGRGSRRRSRPPPPSTRASRPTTSRSRNSHPCGAAREAPLRLPVRRCPSPRNSPEPSDIAAGSPSWCSRRSSSCACSWSIRSSRLSGTPSTSWQGLARGPFVGLANFREVLLGPTMAPVVWNAFLHNVQALVALVIVQNGGGFLLAWLLYKEPFGFRFHRVAVFVPVVLSTIIVGFLWKLFLNPNFGIVNQALYGLGLDALARPWLGDSWTALPALILANAWHFIGFPTLVYLAGMQRIPSEIVEAARLDGTSEWQLLRTIVWPLVAPSDHDPVHAPVHRRLQLVRDPLRDGGARRLALRVDRRARPRLLPHRLRQPVRERPEFRSGLGARDPAVPLHRRLRVDADPVAAPPGDPVLTGALHPRGDRLRPARPVLRGPGPGHPDR